MGVIGDRREAAHMLNRAAFLSMSRDRTQSVMVLHRKNFAAPVVPQLKSNIVNLDSNKKRKERKTNR